MLGLHQDAYVAMDMLDDVAAHDGRRLGPATLMAMGTISERYRANAEQLREQFPAVYRPLGGDEWRRLVKLMESKRPRPLPEAATAAARPRKL